MEVPVSVLAQTGPVAVSKPLVSKAQDSVYTLGAALKRLQAVLTLTDPMALFSVLTGLRPRVTVSLAAENWACVSAQQTTDLVGLMMFRMGWGVPGMVAHP